MKRELLSFFLLFLVVMFPQEGCAQKSKDSLTSAKENIIFRTIPNYLKIRDKIFIENKSPYYILQAIVAIPNGHDDFKLLGSCTYIAPNEVWEVASYSDNWLKNLRGKTIAIKVKGTKKFMGQNNTHVDTPIGSVGINHKELSPEIINSITPADLIYSFDATLFEANHDLYIEIINKGENGKSIMDF